MFLCVCINIYKIFIYRARTCVWNFCDNDYKKYNIRDYIIILEQ